MSDFMSAHPWLFTYGVLQVGFMAGLCVMALCVSLGQRDPVLRLRRYVDTVSAKQQWNPERN